MKTCVEIVARLDARGRTVLPIVRASGQYAVRRTGPGAVHLVATAFGPLGGDHAELRLVVEDGAHLVVSTVAAAVVLPSRTDPSPVSRQLVRAEVAGSLAFTPEPTVVTALAVHESDVRVQLGPDAALLVTEQVLLGRVGEAPGRWTGTTRVERAGRPLLHTTVGLGSGAPAWEAPVAPRAYVSTVRSDGGGPEVAVATRTDAVRLPLPGGWVATAWAQELHDCTDRLAELTGAAQATENERFDRPIE